MSQKNTDVTLFDIVSKIENSNGTVTELRVPIFSPIEKISHTSTISIAFRKNNGIRTIKTAWGEITTRGRELLGQQHRDLLDTIYLLASRFENLKTGGVRIYFCRSAVLGRYFKSDHSKTNHKWLDTKLKEIRDTSIEYKSPNGDSCDFNIIKHLDYDSDSEQFAITLDERYVRFYAEDLSVNYKKLLPDIMGIDSSVIKAIVRFILSHSTIKIGLEKTLATIGYPFDALSRTAQNKLLKDLNLNTDMLRNYFGIKYDKFFRVFEYEKHSDIFFLSSENKFKAIKVEPSKEDQKKVSNRELTPFYLIGQKITRDFNQNGTPITASIYDIREVEKNLFEIYLKFEDETIKGIDGTYTLMEIKKIIDHES